MAIRTNASADLGSFWLTFIIQQCAALLVPFVLAMLIASFFDRPDLQHGNAFGYAMFCVSGLGARHGCWPISSPLGERGQAGLDVTGLCTVARVR